MKTIGIVLLLVGVVFVLMGIQGAIEANYGYRNSTGQYAQLADDAADAKSKLGYLEQYKGAIGKNVVRDDGRYIFKQKQYTRDAQLVILESLMSRLRTTADMVPSSIEYQQAMYQISGQEFDTALQRIDSIMFSCYLRSHFYWFAFPYFIGAGIIIIFVGVCCIAILNNHPEMTSIITKLSDSRWGKD